MLNINGVALDFDITSPLDVLRYKQAGEKMEEESRKIALPSLSINDPASLDGYMEMLNQELRLFGNFLDAVFGAGVGEQLLGHNPSLTKIVEVSDALGAALEEQGRDFGVRLQKYTPNRAMWRR